MQFEEFEQNVTEWAKEKHLLTFKNYKTQFIKVVEETGELGKALLEQDHWETLDALGDVMVTLVILANQIGIKLSDAMQAAWNEIKDRKGKTINGTFIKSVYGDSVNKDKEK